MNLFFPKTGVNNRSTVKSSKRPTNMLNDSIHLEMSGISEKLNTGPSLINRVLRY